MEGRNGYRHSGKEGNVENAQQYLEVQESLRKEERRCMEELTRIIPYSSGSSTSQSSGSLRTLEPQIVSECEKYQKSLESARERYTRELFQKLKSIKADCYALKMYVFDERAAEEGYVPRVKKTLQRIAESLDKVRNEARKDFDKISNEEQTLNNELRELNTKVEEDEEELIHRRATNGEALPQQHSTKPSRPPPPANQGNVGPPLKQGNEQAQQVEETEEADFRSRVEKVNRRIQRNGGETGNWRDDEHEVFLAVVQKYQPSLMQALHGSSDNDPNSEKTPEPTKEQRKKIAEEVHLRIPDRSLDECNRHLDWFLVYCTLLDKKRHIIYEWKQVQRRKKEEELQGEVEEVTSNKEEERRKELAKLKNKTAMQKAEVARWKAEKARQRQEEEHKQYEEKTKKEIAKEQEEARRRAAQKAALAQYRAAQKAEEQKFKRIEGTLNNQSNEREDLTPEQKERIRSRIQSQISSAHSRGKLKLESQEEAHRRQEQSLDPRRDQRGMILKKFDSEVEDNDSEVEEQVDNTAYVKGAGLFKVKRVHSDPNRARAPTTAWKNRERNSREEKNAESRQHSAHERPVMMQSRAADSRGLDFTFGGRGTGKAVPTWRNS
eukprot:gb/GECG01012625.1/.p1 GENE.gb/GECG01012625.1/~~gb/GECG01012625.1/.p1  ORF type:complete len:609 (+),score=125.43 gb/GECG01012625.1/:1-1827(+)